MTGLVENKMATRSAPSKNMGRGILFHYKKIITSDACVRNKAPEYALMNGFMEYIQHLISSIDISGQLYDISMRLHEQQCVIFM